MKEISISDVTLMMLTLFMHEEKNTFSCNICNANLIDSKCLNASACHDSSLLIEYKVREDQNL